MFSGCEYLRRIWELLKVKGSRYIHSTVTVRRDYMILAMVFRLLFLSSYFARLLSDVLVWTGTMASFLVLAIIMLVSICADLPFDVQYLMVEMWRVRGLKCCRCKETMLQTSALSSGCLCTRTLSQGVVT